jgi:hypothetical protein
LAIEKLRLTLKAAKHRTPLSICEAERKISAINDWKGFTSVYDPQQLKISSEVGYGGL